MKTFFVRKLSQEFFAKTPFFKITKYENFKKKNTIKNGSVETPQTTPNHQFTIPNHPKSLTYSPTLLIYHPKPVRNQAKSHINDTNLPKVQICHTGEQPICRVYNSVSVWYAMIIFLSQPWQYQYRYIINCVALNLTSLWR